ncbi:MAG: (2Fe-2S)-binding protein [Chloroflexi bacterium]|nr:(2Fe-2S)-binding protein [Chloroflexota bacterium]
MAIRTRSTVDSLVEKDRVRRAVYTDPSIFSLEMERIYLGSWISLGHESEVPEPGDFKTDEIAGRPILVTRHNDGTVHVLLNACRHRGATVCEIASGNAPAFKCPYHGWTYRSNGELAIVPSQEAFGPDFDRNEYGLRPLPRVATYRGFIFASFNPDVPELEEHLGRAAQYIDAFVDRAPAGKIQVRKPLKTEYAGNWKLQIDNFADGYHPPFTHPAVFGGPTERASRAPTNGTEASRRGGGTRSFGRGHSFSDLGRFRASNRFPEELSLHPSYVSALTDRFGPERARELALADTYLLIYPNLYLQTLLSHFRLVKPQAVDRTHVYGYPCDLVGAPDVLNDELARVTMAWTSPGGEVQVDDMEAFSRVQRGLRADPQEWVLFTMDQNEHVNEYGEVEGGGMGDSRARGSFREWARLMAEPS